MSDSVSDQQPCWNGENAVDLCIFMIRKQAPQRQLRTLYQASDDEDVCDRQRCHREFDDSSALQRFIHGVHRDAV
jgi:hypothetical protein